MPQRGLNVSTRENWSKWSSLRWVFAEPESGVLLKCKTNEFHWHGGMKAVKFDANGHIRDGASPWTSPKYWSGEGSVLWLPHSFSAVLCFVHTMTSMTLCPDDFGHVFSSEWMDVVIR